MQLGWVGRLPSACGCAHRVSTVDCAAGVQQRLDQLRALVGHARNDERGGTSPVCSVDVKVHGALLPEHRGERSAVPFVGGVQQCLLERRLRIGRRAALTPPAPRKSIHTNRPPDQRDSQRDSQRARGTERQRDRETERRSPRIGTATTAQHSTHRSPRSAHCRTFLNSSRYPYTLTGPPPPAPPTCSGNAK